MTTTTPPKRARLTATMAAHQETALHLRSLRALLLQQPPNHNNSGSSNSSQRDDTLQSLQQFTALTACYVQDAAQRRAAQASMQQVQTDALQLQQAVRQALDAHFPVRQRGGKRKATAAATATTTTNTNTTTTSTDLALTTVQNLLAQHARVVQEQHALGISAMVRRGG